MKISFFCITLWILLKVSNGQKNIYLSNQDDTTHESEIDECSVPLDNLNGELSHNCNYRGSVLPELIYRWRSGNGCYSYIQPHLFKQNGFPAIISTCNYQGHHVPCFKKITSRGWNCYPIDMRIQPSYEEVERTVVSESVVHRWNRCINSAMSCCMHHMNLETFKSGPERCPTEWDGWTCWFPGHSGEESKAVCPEFAYSHMTPSCNHFSTKFCGKNGTWNPNSDYSSCSLSPRLLARLNLHLAWLSCSLIAAFPALIILNTFKDIKLILHRNLLAAIVLRNTFVIFTKSMIIKEELISPGPTIMSQNGGFCKTLAVFEKLAAQAVFSCMFMEGIYLHRKIVAIFKKEINLKYAYMVFTVITLIPVIVWICLMATLNNSKCWLVYNKSGIQWSLNGPRITILIINTILYFDILRIFFTKMRNEDAGNKLNTAKATLFLLPLFGIQFFFTFWYPATSSCEWEQFYFVFAYSLDGLQGVVVAVLYCYMNKEVQNRLRVWFQRAKQTWDDKRFPGTKINNLRRRRTSSKAKFENCQEGQNNRISCRDSGVDISYLNNLENDNTDICNSRNSGIPQICTDNNKIIEFEMKNMTFDTDFSKNASNPTCSTSEDARKVEFEMTNLPNIKSPRANSFTSVTFDYDFSKNNSNPTCSMDEDAGKIEQIRKKHLDSLAECFNRHVSDEYTMKTRNNIIDTEAFICEQHNNEDDEEDENDYRRSNTISLGEIGRLRILDKLELNMTGSLDNLVRKKLRGYSKVETCEVCQDKEGEPLEDDLRVHSDLYAYCKNNAVVFDAKKMCPNRTALPSEEEMTSA